MGKTVRAALIQAHANLPKEEAVAKHAEMIGQAAAQGAKIVCLQEIFFGPYFCAQQEPKWFETAEPDDGPTVTAMRELARKHGIVLIVPFFEKEFDGVFYNTAAVIDSDGSVPRQVPQDPHPPGRAGFWEKYFFKPGNLGYPVFHTSLAKVGVYICYDRHFPEGARLLGLNGAEIVFNPSATVAGLSQYLWKLEQPAHAVANGYFVGAINRVGTEAPWNIGHASTARATSSIPRGQIFARPRTDEDEVLVADLDLGLIEEVRTTWQFFRDRRPETYGEMGALLP